MQVNRLTIHFIDKQQRSNVVNAVDKSVSTLTISENVQLLAERLNEAFRKNDNVLKTEFRTPINTFQMKVNLFAQNLSDQNFLDFSTETVDQLGVLLTNNTLSSGGYFVYVDYVHNEVNYLAVFLVRDTEEVIFKKPPGSNNYDVNTEFIINTKKLAMAARVDLSNYLNGIPRYLHFTHRQTNVSRYFTDWIEAEIADRSVEDTRSFIDLINQLGDEDMPINPQTGERYRTDEFRTKLYDNIHSQGRLIRIVDISRTFWGDEEFLINKIEEFGITIDMEFQATETTLRGLKRYEIRSGKMKLTYTQADYESGRISRGDASDQLIIESQELREKFDRLND